MLPENNNNNENQQPDLGNITPNPPPPVYCYRTQEQLERQFHLTILHSLPMGLALAFFANQSTLQPSAATTISMFAPLFLALKRQIERINNDFGSQAMTPTQLQQAGPDQHDFFLFPNKSALYRQHLRLGTLTVGSMVGMGIFFTNWLEARFGERANPEGEIESVAIVLMMITCLLRLHQAQQDNYYAERRPRP